MKKMETVLQYLNALAAILEEAIPIVYLPEFEDKEKDPFKGQCALVIRKPEYMAELDELYNVGKIEKTETTVPEQ
jgi:hypothetical protein